MTEKNNISTGNKIVDEIGQINFSGNVIPEIWYKTIVNDKGKVNQLAILVLADIVYWYRPMEIRDELTSTVSYAKRFLDDDFLQRSYHQICEKFNITKTQATNTIVFLEKLGVIKRHFRNIMTVNGLLTNVMYLELIPDVLRELTYPLSEGKETKKIDTSLQKGRYLSVKKEIPLIKKDKTYTKNDTKTITENTTTKKKEDSVVVIQKVFEGLNLSQKDILSIAKVADYNVEKCINAKVLLEHQKGIIQNVVGWLIKAVSSGYKLHNNEIAVVRNTFNNYQQRDYDYEKLERELLMKSKIKSVRTG